MSVKRNLAKMVLCLVGLIGSMVSISGLFAFKIQMFLFGVVT